MNTISIQLPTIDQVYFTITCEYEDTPVSESLIDLEEEVLRIQNKLDEGNLWAWCCVKVTAKYKGLSASDYLGCCSYEDESDFMNNSGYYAQMKEAAYDELITKIKELA